VQSPGAHSSRGFLRDEWFRSAEGRSEGAAATTELPSLVLPEHPSTSAKRRLNHPAIAASLEKIPCQARCPPNPNKTNMKMDVQKDIARLLKYKQRQKKTPATAGAFYSKTLSRLFLNI
jgi:hypothetical protein